MFSKYTLTLPFFVLFFMLLAACGQQKTGADAAEMPTDSSSLDMKEVITKMESDQSAGTGERLTYTVSLGVMPDMNFTGQGTLIGHVTEGKPAYNAGIQKGDVILEMGGEKVVDLVSYTKVLGTFNKGDQTTVVIRRDDQLMNVLVQF